MYICNILGVRIRLMLATFLRDVTATFLHDVTTTFLSMTDMYIRTHIMEIDPRLESSPTLAKIIYMNLIMQWHLSIPDTLGTESVLIERYPHFKGQKYTHTNFCILVYAASILII